MDQHERARRFAALHDASKPLVLLNIWDAGSARRVVERGAAAIATGSHAVADAIGYEDGEQAPFEDMLWMLQRIVAASSVPVSHDTERGYGETPAQIAETCARVIIAGAVGINLEDSFGDGNLRSIAAHAEIIAQAKQAMERVCQGSWLNARTDVFLDSNVLEADKVEAAIVRGRAYVEGGASSLFVPFTEDLTALATIAREVGCPINAMRRLDGPPISEYAQAGIARISHGPFLFVEAYDVLNRTASNIYAGSMDA